ncbi:MAG: protein tlpB [Chitinophagales bacterium]|nr:protein tlpB [Chitinophagales bacterium]
MSATKKYLPWFFRILVFGLFVLSAVAKSFPIWAFEKQLVDLKFCNWCQAHYLARFIIALELAIGFAMLFNNYIKRIVIPITIGLLVVFCIHLIYQMIQFGAMNGNCGCFGQLIPMTPLEAFIKNIITIAILLYLWKVVEEKPKGQNKLLPLLFMYTSALFLMFALFPFESCFGKGKATSTEQVDMILEDNPSNELLNDIPTDIANDETLDDEIAQTTSTNDDNEIKAVSKQLEKTQIAENAIATEKKDNTTVKTTVTKSNEPKPVKSKFSKYTSFNGKTVNLDQGKKIVCMFVIGCEHCRHAAKEICQMKQANPNFPEVYILFMDEEAENAPDFFAEAGCKIPYKIIDIPEFWTVMGPTANTPGVFYLWNGNIQKSFEGTGDNAFNATALKKAIEAK